MSSRVARTSLAVAAFALLTVVGSQSVLADTELGDHGVVGTHSLSDTHSSPGVTCHYKFASGIGLGKLKSITVQPPNMALATGRSQQIIGWSFTIQRRRQGEQDTVWKQVYRSIRQTTSIGGGDSGGFEPMSTSITLDPNEGVTGIHQFRVFVKMYWYGQNGSTVNGWSKHRVDFYKGVMNTGEHWVDDSYCAGLSPS